MNNSKTHIWVEKEFMNFLTDKESGFNLSKKTFSTFWTVTPYKERYVKIYAVCDGYTQNSTTDKLDQGNSVRCVKNYDSGRFTDLRDGKMYRTITIGNQVWMADNLNYDTVGSSYYEDNPSNGDKYGRLYTCSTAQDVCPSGWELPLKEDFETLFSTNHLDKGHSDIEIYSLLEAFGFIKENSFGGMFTEYYKAYYNLNTDAAFWCKSTFESYHLIVTKPPKIHVSLFPIEKIKGDIQKESVRCIKIQHK